MIHDDYVSGVVGVIGADPPPHVRYECIRCEGGGTEEDGSTCLRCKPTGLGTDRGRLRRPAGPTRIGSRHRTYGR